MSSTRKRKAINYREFIEQSDEDNFDENSTESENDQNAALDHEDSDKSSLSPPSEKGDIIEQPTLEKENNKPNKIPPVPDHVKFYGSPKLFWQIRNWMDQDSKQQTTSTPAQEVPKNKEVVLQAEKPSPFSLAAIRDKYIQAFPEKEELLNYGYRDFLFALEENKIKKVINSSPSTETIEIKESEAPKKLEL